MSEKRPIYAVDFDGTLCGNEWPEIGEENTALIDFLKEKQKSDNAMLVLWTMREGDSLERAVAWCTERGLRFDAINDNVEPLKEAFHNNPRKVYADLYIDDHNTTFWPWGTPGTPSAIPSEYRGDYKERMALEYRELKERLEKLDAILEKHKNGTLDFQLNCPIEVLHRQREAMSHYLDCLCVRAIIEGVEV